MSIIIMERQFSKNMRKILLVDYMGHCFQNQPTGHSLKVLNEYKRLVCDKFEIGIAAPKSIISNTNLSDYIYKIQLPFQIDGRTKSSDASKSYPAARVVWRWGKCISWSFLLETILNPRFITFTS